MKIGSILLAFFLFGAAGFAQKIDENSGKFVEPQFEKRASKTTILIDSIITSQKIPGLSIAVGTGDKIVWAEGFGSANVELEIPVKINTKFRVGSLSKTFTALAIGKLKDDNKIDLDLPIQTYVPSFPKKKYGINIRQLAGHIAGIRHYNYLKNEYTSNIHFKNVNESLNIFKFDPLLFKPGTKYFYSTYGYVLLSAAIEGASKQSFLQYMESNIFKPLDMNNTMADFKNSLIINRAHCYFLSKGILYDAVAVDNSNKWGGGGFLSTPVDIVKMGLVLVNDEFLRKETIELLFTSQKLINGTETSYGMGWRIGKDARGKKYVYHSGTSIGGKAFVLIYPHEKVVAAIAANVNANFDEKMMLKISGYFLPEN
jgi:serine beta-lactamase-like protein LACTB, mitochondrial